MERSEEQRRSGLEPAGETAVPDERQARLWPNDAAGVHPGEGTDPGAGAGSGQAPSETRSGGSGTEEGRQSEAASFKLTSGQVGPAQSGLAREQTRPRTTALSQPDKDDLSGRWDGVQGGFVDDPHAAVHQADLLVGETLDRIRQVSERRRAGLREAADNAGDTEGLRLTIREYRAFLWDLLHS